MPKDATTPHKPLVVALTYDGIAMFELSIAVEIFGLPRPEVGENWYRFATASLDPSPLRTTAGIQLITDGGLERFEDAHTIIIPSWRGPDRAVPPHLVEAIKAAHARGTRIASICGGAYVLAAAGLLDGRKATTHWRYIDEFRCDHPELNLLPNVLYVDEGSVMTSAGSAAGIDMCLHIVRQDFGVEIANKVACRLVVPPHRDGGQAQFIERAVPAVYESDRLGPLLDHMRGNLQDRHNVSDLADKAGMSVRTFLRRFEDVTGLTPAKWLLIARLQNARDLLEATDMPVEAIAETCGFGTPVNLRHHFREQLNTTPSAYRQTFQVS